MRLSKNDNDGGWIEAKRKNSKTGSKDSSIKSSASTTSQSSGKQVEKMKRIIREEGKTKLENLCICQLGCVCHLSIMFYVF